MGLDPSGASGCPIARALRDESIVVIKEMILYQLLRDAGL